LRRAELWLAVAAAVVLALAALAGERVSPGESWDDPRASTFSAGPRGAKGLAQVLRRLGIQVRLRRRPVFDLARASPPPSRGEVHAFLDIYVPPAEEIAAVREFVGRGGRIFAAGYTGIERCFGYASRYIGRGRLEEGAEPIEVVPPDSGWTLPGTRRVLERLSAESLFTGNREATRHRETCPLLRPIERRVLLWTKDARPVALALGFDGGGRAVLLADVGFVANRALKETDAGLMVIPWLLGDALQGSASPSPGFSLGDARRVVVDEFHQGFGSGRTFWDLAGVAFAWLASQPAGWAVLQLLAVGLIALFVTSARFGPSRGGVERRRRSPIEHLEALAAGLEGAAGADTAIELIVGGLRRRLGRGGHVPLGAGREWLDALELALPEGRGRQAARRLKWIITQRGGDERVLGAAQAVEDVWEQLHPRRTRD
jgi:uncharacterized protein DUF4350